MGVDVPKESLGLLEIASLVVCGGRAGMSSRFSLFMVTRGRRGIVLMQSDEVRENLVDLSDEDLSTWTAMAAAPVFLVLFGV